MFVFAWGPQTAESAPDHRNEGAKTQRNIHKIKQKTFEFTLIFCINNMYFHINLIHFLTFNLIVFT